MTRKNLESILPDDELLFLVINVKGYAVKFEFDNVYSCCPGARVSDTECDHICALLAYMSDILNTMSNAGNEIDRRTRCNRDESRAIWGRRFFFYSELEVRCFNFTATSIPTNPT